MTIFHGYFDINRGYPSPTDPTWCPVRQVAGDSLRAYGRTPLGGEVRKSPRWRHWLLASSIMALRTEEKTEQWLLNPCWLILVGGLLMIMLPNI